MKSVLRVIGFLGLFLPLPAQATTILAMSLEQMAQRAEKIFVGRCVSAEQSINSQGLGVMTLTFDVSEVIKGEVGRTFMFRQLSPSPLPQPAHSTGVGGRIMSWQSILDSIPGLPSYTPGEEVVLFLGREGRLGLRSPVGLAQGVFPVVTTALGKKYVSGNVMNLPSLKAVIPSASEGRVRYTTFVKTIRSLYQAKPPKP